MSKECCYGGSEELLCIEIIILFQALTGATYKMLHGVRGMIVGTILGAVFRYILLLLSEDDMSNVFTFPSVSSIRIRSKSTVSLLSYIFLRFNEGEIMISVTA